jgi:hypothetical protein
MTRATRPTARRQPSACISWNTDECRSDGPAPAAGPAEVGHATHAIALMLLYVVVVLALWILLLAAWQLRGLPWGF